MLQYQRDNSDELYEFIRNNFGISGNIEKWESLILNIESKNEIHDISIFNIQNKRLKDIILRFKIKFSIGNLLPSINIFYFLFQKFKEKKYDFIFQFKL